MASMIERVARGFSLEAMSNLRTKSTGVEGAVIWVSAGEFAGAEMAHGPRVKVVLGEKVNLDGLGDAVTVRIAKPPVVLGKLPANVQREVVKFVTKNYDTLLAYWKGEIDTADMVAAIKKV